MGVSGGIGVALHAQTDAAIWQLRFGCNRRCKPQDPPAVRAQQHGPPESPILWAPAGGAAADSSKPRIAIAAYLTNITASISLRLE